MRVKDKGEKGGKKRKGFGPNGRMTRRRSKAGWNPNVQQRKGPHACRIDGFDEEMIGEEEE